LLKNDVNTPQAVVNIDVLDLNIKRMNDVVKQYGVKLRPHIKTHRTPAIAHRQLAAGACGITVAKLGEAEMMAACGIKDSRNDGSLWNKRYIGCLSYCWSEQGGPSI